MKKSLLTLLFLIYLGILYSQNHDFIWPYGYSAPGFHSFNVSYKTAPPHTYFDYKSIYFTIYAGACSDSTGDKLLFYTNGLDIQNANNVTMANGSPINPGQFWGNDTYSSEIGALVVPTTKNRYYVFHIAIRLDSNLIIEDAPLYYSLVNMNMENGLGRVTARNKKLLDFPVIPFAAAKHGNGRDWWVMTARYSQPEYYRFLVTPQGVQGPFVQNIGPPLPLPGGAGNNLFALDGNTYIHHDARNGLRIFDFDRCTGLLSNLRIVPYKMDTFYSLSATISADSRFLYLNTLEALMQVDLTADDIGASADTLQVYDNYAVPYPFGTAFLNAGQGANGKIYIATQTSARSIHVINNPELPGQAADFEQRGQYFGKVNCLTVCHFPNYRLGTWAGSPCDTFGLASPAPGFTDMPYEQRVQSREPYRVMSAIGGNQPYPKYPLDPTATDFFFRLEAERDPKLKAQWEEILKKRGERENKENVGEH